MKKKITIGLFSAALFYPFTLAQAACMSLSSPCVSVTVNSDATAVSCTLNDLAPGDDNPGVCMVDLTDVVTQVNGNSTVQEKNISISNETPMVIQAWGGNGAKSISSEGHDNKGGTGGYAQTVTTISEYSLTNFSSNLFYFMGEPGNSPEGKEQSHCGSGGGASTVVSPFDLSATPGTRPTLAEVMLVAGGGGGAGGFNASGACDFGGGGKGGPGAKGGVAIATGNKIDAAGGTNQDDENNCTSNGGGDWNAKGGGGSGGGGDSGAGGVGSWGGGGGGGSSCSPGAFAKWVNTFADFTAAAVDSGGGGNTDTSSCTAGGGGGGGGYGGGGGGRHGNSTTYSCGGGGGGSYAVKSTSAGGPQTMPPNPYAPYGVVTLQFLVDASPSPSPIGVTQTMNADSYQEGDVMTVGVSAQNAQSPTDFFMGALLPDGNTMYFVTELLPLTLHQGFLDDPHTYRPVSDRGVIPDGVIVSLPGLVSHLITGVEPIGNYKFFSALTQPNAFGNGSIDNGDFLALDIDPFTVQGPESE